jgi:hypothetical protein
MPCAPSNPLTKIELRLPGCQSGLKIRNLGDGNDLDGLRRLSESDTEKRKDEE